MDHLSFVITSDGSKTIFNEQVGENYHSRHGALQESKHVFLNSGLNYYLEKKTEKKASILELGFGTGLNFLVTADYCIKNQIQLSYTGIEAFPLNQDMIAKTGYQEYVSEKLWDSFLNNYSVALNTMTKINDACLLEIAPLLRCLCCCSSTRNVEFGIAKSDLQICKAGWCICKLCNHWRP
jgi:tRNA U34 5-methylaminomethyl-2-thiouridine-forming methyltransferase MnmC